MAGAKLLADWVSPFAGMKRKSRAATVSTDLTNEPRGANSLVEKGAYMQTAHVCATPAKSRGPEGGVRATPPI